MTCGNLVSILYGMPCHITLKFMCLFRRSDHIHSTYRGSHEHQGPPSGLSPHPRIPCQGVCVIHLSFPFILWVLLAISSFTFTCISTQQVGAGRARSNTKPKVHMGIDLPRGGHTPYVSKPRAIKVCYPILYAIDNF